MLTHLTWRHLAAAAAALAPTIALAQLSVLHTDTLLQYGGAGNPQTVIRDPWLASFSAPPWEGEADMSMGEMRVAVANTSIGAANTYASLSITIANTSAGAVPLGTLNMSFDGFFSQTDDGSDGSHATRLISIASLTHAGQVHTARLDHTYSAICISNRQDCRSQLDTTPVIAGMAGVSVNTATPSFIDAVLQLPAITLAGGSSAQYLLSFQAAAFADDGWAAAVDAMNSAQLAMQLPAGVSITSARPLAWITPVPEPAGAWLWAVGALPVWLCARRRVRAR